MLIPCIDLQNGQAVQLVHGRKRELAVADVFGLLDRFKNHPWLHVIDLDAAMGKGENLALLRELCKLAKRKHGTKVRVGGGIRTVARARELLGVGATQIIVGSAAFQRGLVNVKFLSTLTRTIAPRHIVIALDTWRGQIVIHGWRKKLSLRPEEVVHELEPYCSGFLCTEVDREGTMSGSNLEWFKKIRAATAYPVIAAGGIRTWHEILALEQIEMDAAVGMAMYKNRLR
ncbi:MAG TPA: HisA/HisF-related TIM barrel protein [Terriglobales bacterium]|nr:HisA/HisF-related TIM barrel protein [Terriglobales bacterium]